MEHELYSTLLSRGNGKTTHAAKKRRHFDAGEITRIPVQIEVVDFKQFKAIGKNIMQMASVLRCCCCTYTLYRITVKSHIV